MEAAIPYTSRGLVLEEGDGFFGTRAKKTNGKRQHMPARDIGAPSHSPAARRADPGVVPYREAAANQRSPPGPATRSLGRPLVSRSRRPHRRGRQGVLARHGHLPAWTAGGGNPMYGPCGACLGLPCVARPGPREAWGGGAQRKGEGTARPVSNDSDIEVQDLFTGST